MMLAFALFAYHMHKHKMLAKSLPDLRFRVEESETEMSGTGREGPSNRDGFGRAIEYLRVSLTDRCNFRCTYCMPLRQSFMKREHLLSYEEIVAIVERFSAHGVRKVRLTGGEPMVRRDFDVLARRLGQLVAEGRLEELTLTTNGSLLADNAQMLFDAGIRRINVSLDTLDPEGFTAISRGTASLDGVLSGIEAARRAGLDVRLNMVALRGQNQDQLIAMMGYAAGIGASLCLIETMPLGNSIEERRRTHIGLDEFIEPISENEWRLVKSSHESAGPARYFTVEPLGLRLGLITPLSSNFCAGCNRLRLSADGKIHPCLGSDLSFDLKDAYRRDGISAIDGILSKALRLKPERHDFEEQLAAPEKRLKRHMNTLGG